MQTSQTVFLFLCLSLLIILPSRIEAQTTQAIPAKPQISYAQSIGTTAPLRDLVRASTNGIYHRQNRKRRDKPFPNFPGRGKNELTRYAGAPYNGDPLTQGGSFRGKRTPIEPEINVEGIDRAFAGARVPDANGDIGFNYYVQSVNASFFQVFDKQGNAVGNPVDFNLLWIDLGFTSAGDPIVLFDQEYNRWIITEFPLGNQLLIAISETDDPLGSYKAYNFGTPRFPDYPKYAIWSNAVYLTTNEMGARVQHAYFLDRLALMNGNDTVSIQRIEIPGIQNSPGFMVATPVDWSGATSPPPGAQPMVMYIQDDAWGEVAQDEIEIFSFDVNFDHPDSTTYTQFSLPTAPFDSDACAAPGFNFACIPQPDSDGLDGLPWTIMHQTHYRNFTTHESIVLNFAVNASTNGDILSGIRWMELRRSAPTEAWTVYQEGTFSLDDGLHRFMGAIAQDGIGNIGLAYNVSAEDEYAGLRFTGRKVNDPLGAMTIDEYNVATGRSATSDDRFGDYSSMAVDPSDDQTFWFTGEYMGPDNLWGTKVLAFVLTRDTIDMGPTQLTAPITSADLTANEVVRATYKNLGLDTIYQFVVGYEFEGDSIFRDTVQVTLPADSIYEHTFSHSVDVSEIGSYSFRIFAHLLDDENVLNDEIEAEVLHLAHNDVGITSLYGQDETICSDTAVLEVEIENFGADTVFTADLMVWQQGSVVFQDQWQGTLAYGETTLIPFTLFDLVSGENNFTVMVSNPNGNPDEAAGNDTLQSFIDVIGDGQLVTLEITPDIFPDEITWQLRNDSNQIVYSGGPYPNETFIQEVWCLRPTCHTFEIFDAAADGICCAFGNGSYEIIDAQGRILVASDGRYGASEEHTFCVESCMVSAEIYITEASADTVDDGALLVVASNGAAPYQFSLDGGNSFQLGNLFDNLSVGTYYLQVRDRKDCIYYDTITIGYCTLEVFIESTDASTMSSTDGRITFHASGNQGALLYSIDQGVTFQSDSVFEDLAVGTYIVVVQDSAGCSYTDTIDIFYASGTTSFHNQGRRVILYPNPTDGLFVVEVIDPHAHGLFLPYQLYDGKGGLLASGTLVKYDQRYQGELTIERFPAGIYYLTFPKHPETRMVRIIKK